MIVYLYVINNANELGKPQSYVVKVESGERRIDLIEALDLCQVVSLDSKVLITTNLTFAE